MSLSAGSVIQLAFALMKSTISWRVSDSSGFPRTMSISPLRLKVLYVWISILELSAEIAVCRQLFPELTLNRSSRQNSSSPFASSISKSRQSSKRSKNFIISIGRMLVIFSKFLLNMTHLAGYLAKYASTFTVLAICH